MYKELRYLDGNLIFIDNDGEGISSNAIINGLKNEGNIVPSMEKLGDKHAGKYALYKPGVKKLVARYPYGYDELFNGLNELKIKNPYTYILENGLDGLEFLCYSGYDGNLYDINKVIQPRAMYFDYIEAHMNDYCYDLDEVVSALSKRDDIIWNHRDQWYQTKKEYIYRIPSYNADDDRQYFISFIWTPKEEDFAKIREELTSANSFSQHDIVASKIFGLKKKQDF